MSGHPVGTPWATVDELRRRHDEAAKDPRVGDVWTNQNGKTAEIIPPDDERVKTKCSDGSTWWTRKENFAEIIARWTLAARGPKPDPRTVPTLGVKLRAKDGEIREATRLNFDGSYVEYRFENGPLGTKGENVMTVEAWTHIHKDAEIVSEPKGERDPRVDPVFGDELKCIEGHTREVGEVGKNGQGCECVWYDQYTPGGNRYIREMCYLGDWREMNKGAEILAYGDRQPAAEPPAERDPATQPVVGDEWERGDDKITVRRALKSGEIELAIDYGYGCDKTVTRWTVERLANEIDAFSMKLIRRGDDPEWRPKGERSEQPAAGIKVGDRVRHLHREEGVVVSKDAYGVKIQFDGDNKTQTFSFADVRHWLTIIPPAAAPAAEQPEPIEAIDRNPHTEPLVGDEWEDGDEDTLQVIYVGDDSVVMWNDDYKYASQWSRKEFAEESFAWRLSKAADLDPDDVGDEPPTTAFEGDPSNERFTTYQSDPVEERFHRDDKYIRRIFSRSGNESIDVDIYNVLDAYKTGCPAIDHATKKLLCAGIRGSKSRMQDLREARDSIMRAMEMQMQRETKGSK